MLDHRSVASQRRASAVNRRREVAGASPWTPTDGHRAPAFTTVDCTLI
ncbi:hypothetical protein A2U01_0092481 [Trifolium medium]|uniref:Uncharacterized protein n=1 Tax=Trifolium medium TaxID=97028 RepID=A0A392UDV4_9FABA|nr:hypothetical protein [Trifolium medium]